MDLNMGPDSRMQPIENKRAEKGKKRARISPRQLSPLTRQLIFDEFVATGDMDAVAETYRVPVRTVDSILHWFTLRKPPGVETRGLQVMRRTA